MADEFKSYVLDDLAPPWLLRPEGKAWLQAFSELKDAQVVRMKQGVKLRFPLEADASALAAIGKDNRIERGHLESESSYRSRLAAALEIWSKGGTRLGILAAVNAAGAPDGAESWTNAETITNREWPDLGGGDGVPPDANTAKWARFWLVIAAPLGFNLDGGWQDDGDWGAPDPTPLWGTADLFEELDNLRRALELWRPFHARAMGVWFTEGASPQIDEASVLNVAWAEPSALFDSEFAIYWRLE